MSDRQQVKVINAGFLENYRKAQDLPKAERKKFLTRWMSDSAAEQMAANITAQRADHRRSKGNFVSNVVTVMFHDDEAVVRDCIDQSNFAMIDERTGKNVGRGHGNYFLAENRLIWTDAGWRVNVTEDLKKTCTPPS